MFIAVGAIASRDDDFFVDGRVTFTNNSANGYGGDAQCTRGVNPACLLLN